ncbi:MAG: hypothetical protein HY821_04170 [Acidobacteria bacterium]|nr:hypothetical protein [Acidobacteriota bacterium]
MRRVAVLFLLACTSPARQASVQQPVAVTAYHLTPRPWLPLQIPTDAYLDAVEGLCRFSLRHQEPSGAIIDPFLHREHQYATPYFAAAVGTLLSAGRARDLLSPGVRAMEHATACFAGGRAAIPDQHGEFFIPALTEALELYKPHVSAAVIERWKERLRKPRQEVVRGGTNNWETYAMKGEWLRMQAGLVPRAEAVAFIESAWSARQRGRFSAPPWFLYHDLTSEPDTLSVEAVGRGNILALVALGYDGPGAAEMRQLAEDATRLTLFLQDPSGQVPANGRTDDHVWVDAGYQLAFEVMAARAFQAKDAWLAGQYRRAALLAFRNIQRWRRSDAPFDGSYFITKNRFDPALRVGYQEASQYSNYSGSLMFHLGEAYLNHRVDIPQRPTPSEIGGYAIQLDDRFSTAFANAGGMQIQANLRGQLKPTHGNLWTPLGLVRFARAGWDTRLGPADGALTAAGGVSFAPEFLEAGRWLRMASLSDRYEARWSAQFVHPLLVRCRLEYLPKPGQTGPTFQDDLLVTPDGVLSTIRLTSPGDTRWGVTWPVLESDGTPLIRSSGDRIRSVRFPGSAEAQNFIALQDTRMEDGPLLRGSYGDLRAVRALASGREFRTFIYPQSASDPAGEQVLQSLKAFDAGIESILARVEGTLYNGRTAAGGVGAGIDLNHDGKADITFSERCGFYVQLRSGRPIQIETDRPVRATLSGRRLSMKAHIPVPL